MTGQQTKKKTNPGRVAVLRTSVGFPLVIRANPSAASVKRFAKEHNRRFLAGEPGGPSGEAAFQITGAWFFEEESATDDYDFESGTEIDLKSVL